MSITPTQPDMTAQRAWLWLALIMLVGLALRLYRLGVEPLWHDEVFELIQVEDFWGTLLTGANVTSHPPLYVVLMKVTEVLGLHGTEWGVRILAAALGVSTIPAVYLTVAHLFTRRLGVVAAAVLAVSVFHIVHSQDAKSYILLPLTGALLVYCALRAWETSGRWWVVYAVCAAAAFYSQAFALPLLLLLNGWYLYLALREKRPIVPWFVANVAAFVLVLPWIVIMLGKAGDIMIAAEDWWVPRPGLRELVLSVKTMAFGYSDQRPAYFIALFGCLALAAWGAWNLYPRYPRHTVLTALWFAFPILFLFGLSQVTNSLFLFRAMLPFAIPLYALAAAGILAIPRMPMRIAAAVLLFASTLPSLSDHYFREYGPHEFPHRPGIHLPIDYDAAAAFILEGWQEGDRVLLSSNASVLPMYHYGLRDKARRTRTVSVNMGHIDFILRSNPPVVSTNPLHRDYFPELITEHLDGARRIWFVFSEWEQALLHQASIETWRWLDARFTEIDHRAWRGIEVFLYDMDDDARVRFRDHDDGVRALEEVSLAEGVRIEREKILPDDGIVRQPLHHRRGALTLAWDGPGAAVITNETGEAVEVDIHVVHSAGIVPIAAWLDDELARRWRIHPWYHFDPPPPAFELPTATLALAPDARDTLQGAIPARLGPLNPNAPGLLCWIGPNAHEGIGRARLTMEIAGQSVDIGWTEPEPGWGWSPLHAAHGIELPAGENIPVLFRAEAPQPHHDTHANLAFLALSSPGFEAAARRYTGEVIEPREERVVFFEPGAPRTDIWVFEKGENGRLYRIHRDER